MMIPRKQLISGAVVPYRPPPVVTGLACPGLPEVAGSIGEEGPTESRKRRNAWVLAL
jgi:hypothetical protein